MFIQLCTRLKIEVPIWFGKSKLTRRTDDDDVGTVLVVSVDSVERKLKRGKWQFTGSHKEANITKPAVAVDVVLMVVVRKVILSLTHNASSTRTSRHVCTLVYLLSMCLLRCQSTVLSPGGSDQVSVIVVVGYCFCCWSVKTIKF